MKMDWLFLKSGRRICVCRKKVLMVFVMEKQNTLLRRSMSVEKQVVLYYLMDEGRYRKVGNAFRISRSSVPLIVRSVYKAIARQLGTKFVKFPYTDGQ